MKTNYKFTIAVLALLMAVIPASLQAQTSVSGSRISSITEGNNDVAMNIGNGIANVGGIIISGANFSGSATDVTQANNVVAMNIGGIGGLFGLAQVGGIKITK